MQRIRDDVSPYEKFHLQLAAEARQDRFEFLTGVLFFFGMFVLAGFVSYKIMLMPPNDTINCGAYMPLTNSFDSAQ